MVVVVILAGCAASGRGGGSVRSTGASSVPGSVPSSVARSVVTFQCNSAPPARLPGSTAAAPVCATGADGSPPVSIGGLSPATLSPDGAQVAYRAQIGGRASNIGELRVARHDGTGERVVWRFTAEAQGAPAWNPTGDRLALTIRGTTYGQGPPPPGSTPAGLWTIDIDGNGTRHLAPEAVGPVTWSPAGTSIAYATDTNPPQLKQIAADGGTPSPLQSGRSDAGQQVDTLSWSPDGGTVLASFSAVRAGTSRIEKISAGGGPSEVVLRGSAAPGGNSTQGTDFQGAIYSPDGTQFAVAVGCITSDCQGGTGSGQQLEVAALDGSGRRRLDTGGNRADLRPTSWVRRPADLRG